MSGWANSYYTLMVVLTAASIGWAFWARNDNPAPRPRQVTVRSNIRLVRTPHLFDYEEHQ